MGNGHSSAWKAFLLGGSSIKVGASPRFQNKAANRTKLELENLHHTWSNRTLTQSKRKDFVSMCFAYVVFSKKNSKLVHSFRNSKCHISQWNSSSTQYSKPSQFKVCSRLFYIYSLFLYLFSIFPPGLPTECDPSS